MKQSLALLLCLCALSMTMAVDVDDTTGTSLRRNLRRAGLYAKDLPAAAAPNKAKLAECLTVIKAAKIPVCDKDNCYEFTDPDWKCREFDDRNHATLVTGKDKCQNLKQFTPAGKGMWHFSRHTFDPFYLESPAYVVLPRKAEDVSTILKCAHDKSVSVAVKSGGHSYAGGSSITGEGFVVFMHLMDKIEFKATPTPHLVVQSGARWKDIYATAWAGASGKKYVVTGGTCPSVSTGYVLGGGVGPNSRLHGMGVDNIEEVTLVKYDGGAPTAVTPTSDAVLFKSLMGAGQGSWGIVTSYKLKAHESKHTQFTTGRYTWTHLDAANFKGALMQFVSSEKTTAPELTITVKIGKNPKIDAGKPYFMQFDYDFFGDPAGIEAAFGTFMNQQQPGLTPWATCSKTDPPTCHGSEAGKWKKGDAIFKDTKPTYPEFAVVHASHMRYYETIGLELIYKNVMIEHYTAAMADALIKVMDDDAAVIGKAKNQQKKPMFVYTHIQFPSSKKTVAATATAFPWRSHPFMLVRVALPMDSPAHDKLCVDSNTAFAAAMDKAAGKKLGYYASFPDAFPGNENIHQRYFGDNWAGFIETKFKAWSPAGTFNPLAYRGILNLHHVHRAEKDHVAREAEPVVPANHNSH